MMVDTDVLIWYLRGNPKAKTTIKRLGTFAVSAVVYMEIIQGVRNKQELRCIKSFFYSELVQVVPITAEISSRAIYFIEDYGLSHGLRMADALIAATADCHSEPLLTGNAKDYTPIRALEIKKFIP